MGATKTLTGTILLIILACIGLVTGAIVLAAHIAFGSRSTGTGGQTSAGRKRVYVSIRGDDKLARKFDTFFKIELDDAGFAVANSQLGADFVVKGEITKTSQDENLYAAIIRSELNSAGAKQEFQVCAGASDSENSDLFDNSAKRFAQDLREKLPKAHTVAISGASETRLSEEFRNMLPTALGNAGFTVVSEVRKPDLVLRTDLVRVAVPVQKEIIKYKLDTTRAGAHWLDTEGSRPFAMHVKDQKAVPGACDPGLFGKDWYQNSDPVFDEARFFARQLAGDYNPLKLGVR